LFVGVAIAGHRLFDRSRTRQSPGPRSRRPGARRHAPVQALE
jgi:hypothetical protein